MCTALFKNILEKSLHLDYFFDSHRNLLKGDPVFVVPEVFDELSSRRVITMELVHGVPLDRCVDLNQETRNEVG